MDVARAKAQSVGGGLFAAPEGAAPLTEVRGFHSTAATASLCSAWDALKRAPTTSALSHIREMIVSLRSALNALKRAPTTPGLFALSFC